ncbi:F-box-like protein [Ceratobasidium sp. AG-Ba]|nr:F-box-like protein [Ceratobasidium sp. AG-Ba]
MDSFVKLDSIGVQFTCAVSAVHDACVALTRFVSTHDSNIIGKEWIEDGLYSIENQLGSLAGIEEKLVISLTTLRRLANKSKHRVPISALPAELLSRILGLVVSSPPDIRKISEDFKLHPYCVIPSVCASWRHLVMNTPSFWTHVYLYEGYNPLWLNITSKALLWSENARDAPVHINFCSEHEFSSPELELQIRKLTTRAKSLIFSFFTDDSYVSDIFRLYNASGGSDVLEVISIDGFYNRAVVDPYPVNWLDYIPCCLMTLSLVNIYEPVTPNLDELMTLLARCSKLHTLVLCNARVTPVIKNSCREIFLPDLEYLRISFEQPLVSERLFSTITPGTRDLHLWLSFPEVDYRQHQYVVHNFLQRSRVTSLSLDALKPELSNEIVSQLLDRLPGLRYLLLNLEKDSEGRVLDALVVSVGGQEYRARYPTIRTLAISHGIGPLAQQRLKSVIGIYDIKTLVFYDSYFSDKEHENTNSSEDAEEHDIKRWIGARIRNVEYHYTKGLS